MSDRLQIEVDFLRNEIKRLQTEIVHYRALAIGDSFAPFHQLQKEHARLVMAIQKVLAMHQPMAADALEILQIALSSVS